MAGMNQQLNDDIETVFLMADVSLQPIASKLVKEIARYGGAIDKFVTPAVAAGRPQPFEWRFTLRSEAAAAMSSPNSIGEGYASPCSLLPFAALR